jgi:hypothetical protein
LESNAAWKMKEGPSEPLFGERFQTAMLRWLKTVVVSDVEKASMRRQVGIRKASESESLMTCRKLTGGIKTGGVDMAPGRVWREPAYWPDGARHGGDASLVCCFHVERGKAGSGIATQMGGVRERPETAETVRG